MRALALAIGLLVCAGAARAGVFQPLQEWWDLDQSEDGTHPDGVEQAWLWQMNRARTDPIGEGLRLAGLADPVVQLSYDVFDTDLALLEDEFAALAPVPPAAFDRRLWSAARDHAQAMIDADAPFVAGQLDRVVPAGFVYPTVEQAKGNAYGFAVSPLHGHAVWAANWGAGPGGMVAGRPNRAILMGALANVGIAVLDDADGGDLLGPLVAVANHADANVLFPDHYNRFLVGTVWRDLDGSGRYEPGEGVAEVRVSPSGGDWFAITAAGGGFAIPVDEGAHTVHFSSGGVPTRDVDVVVATTSVLVDYVVPAPEPRALAGGLAAAAALVILAGRRSLA